MISYFERSFALDAQESKTSALSAWLLLSGLLHVLLLLATGLTLTQEIVLLLQKTTAFLGHHPAAMRTWRENKMNGEKLLLYTRLWYHIDSNLSKCSIVHHTIAVQDLLSRSDELGCSDCYSDSLRLVPPFSFTPTEVCRQSWTRRLNNASSAEHQAGVGAARVIEKTKSREYCSSNANFPVGLHRWVCCSCEMQKAKTKCN